jgi:hypothetical protein
VVIGQNDALGAYDDPRPKARARLFVWGLVTKKELKPRLILMGIPFFAWLFLIDLAGEDIDNRGARNSCCLGQRAWILADAFRGLPQGHLTHQGAYLGAGNPTRLEGGYHEPRGQQDGDGLAKEEPKAIHYSI